MLVITLGKIVCFHIRKNLLHSLRAKAKIDWIILSSLNEFKNCFLSTIKDKIQKLTDVSRCVKVTRMLCKGGMLIICDF